MAFLFYGFCILLGFVLGYFLQTTVLIIVSSVSIVVSAILLLKMKEMAVLAAWIVTVALAVANAVMWVTWYFASDQTFIQDFFQNNILR